MLRGREDECRAANPSRRALSARCHALLAPRGSALAEEGFRTALRLHPADAGEFERARALS